MGRPCSSERVLKVAPRGGTGRRIRVAAYCRVSTDGEDQKTSIGIQREHFASLAAKNEDWLFTGVYADIVSGTKRETRPELQRLLSDCARGRVDLVLIKSVSRLARNTTDLLEMVRSLTTRGTDIYFERENIDTRTMGSEFLLTVLASLAEDESRSISSNSRWGIQKRFENGTYRTSAAPYGYDLKDGTYIINPKEAEIVKEIFRRALKEETLRGIAEDLNGRGVRTKRFGEVWRGEEKRALWTGAGIGVLLRNISYTGDILLQKSYRDAAYRVRRNTGAYPLYRISNHHPAIIDRETFEAVQAHLDRNKHERRSERTKTPLSGLLVCGHCGARLVRQVNRAGTVFWVCGRHKRAVQNCPLPSVQEIDLVRDFSAAFEALRQDEGELFAFQMEKERAWKTDLKVRAMGEQFAAVSRLEEALALNRTRMNPRAYLESKNALAGEREALARAWEESRDGEMADTERLISCMKRKEGGLGLQEMTELSKEVVILGRGDFEIRFRCGFTYAFDGRKRT